MVDSQTGPKTVPPSPERPYNSHMTNNKPMQTAHNGCFMLNDTAAADPAVQMAMKSYMEQIQREAMRAKAIREGRIANDGQMGSWNISDRH